VGLAGLAANSVYQSYNQGIGKHGRTIAMAPYEIAISAIRNHKKMIAAAMDPKLKGEYIEKGKLPPPINLWHLLLRGNI
jgi:hypothetical protein